MHYADPGDAVGLSPFEVGFPLGLLVGERALLVATGDARELTSDCMFHDQHPPTSRE
jgi:hypothetical protein